ncbi:MAG: hypothetical protein ACM3Y9_00360 [Ignavibacteria bacterium]
MGRAFFHGWISLPSQGELYLEHGVPRQVRVPDAQAVDVERLLDEVEDVTGLHVTIGRWLSDAEAGDMEAVIQVHAEDVTEVLRRLAQRSAEAFYDRYHKPMDRSDIDFDEEAYAQDISEALAVCGLQWRQIDDSALRFIYERALHSAVAEIAANPED